MTPAHHAARRADWLFLLAGQVDRRVAVAGGGDVELERALVAAGVAVADAVADADEDDGRPHESTDADVVVVPLGPAGGGTRAVVERAVAAAGHRHGPDALVVETVDRRSRRRLARLARRHDLRIRQYGCWPSCRTATRFVPLDDRAELAVATSSAKNPVRRAVGTVLSRIGLGSIVFGEAVSTLARDHAAIVPAPVTAAFGDVADGSMSLLTPRYGSSRHVIALVTALDGERRVVKTSRVPGDDDQLVAEARGLTSVGVGGPARAELVADLDHDRRRWIVQTHVAGDPLTRADVAADVGGWLLAADRWLAAMPVTGVSAPDLDGRTDRLIRPAIDVVSAQAAVEPALAPLVEAAEHSVSAVGGTPLPVVAEHGDFRPPNLIVVGDRDLAAVDWELAEADGFPLHDLWFLHAFVADVAPDVRAELAHRRAARLSALGVDADPSLAGHLATIAAVRQLAHAIERGTGTASGPSVSAADADVAVAWRADRALPDTTGIPSR